MEVLSPNNNYTRRNNLMVKVTAAEEKLKESLKEFQNETARKVEMISYGLDLAKKSLNAEENENMTRINNILEELKKIVKALMLGFDKDESDDESRNLWISFELSDSDYYYYRDGVTDKPLTEKTLIFTLLIWMDEIKIRLAVMETVYGGFDQECCIIKSKLWDIIEDYFNAV